MTQYTLKRKMAFKFGKGNFWIPLCITKEGQRQRAPPFIEGYHWQRNIGNGEEHAVFSSMAEVKRVIAIIESIPHRKYLYKIEKVTPQKATGKGK